MTLIPKESSFSPVRVGVGMLNPVASKWQLKIWGKRLMLSSRQVSGIDWIQYGRWMMLAMDGGELVWIVQTSMQEVYLSTSVKSWALHEQQDQWNFSVGPEEGLKVLEGLTKEYSMNSYCLLLWMACRRFTGCSLGLQSRNRFEWIQHRVEWIQQSSPLL